MTVWISSKVISAIVADSDRTHGQEVCGLLFGTPERIDGHMRCRNVAADPRDTFEIDPSQLILAHKAARLGGPQIMGSYHSHPGGAPIPSTRDALAAAADGAFWLIAAARNVALWRAVARGTCEGRFDQVAFDQY